MKYRLPISELEAATHSFEILTYRGRDPGLKSRVVVVGTPIADPWSLLAKHEADLGNYKITKAELAYDVDAASLDEARDKLFELVKLLDKPGHGRNRIRSVHKPYDHPPPGCVAEPTFYYDHRRSSVALKCYVRHKKLPAGSFGGFCIRVEWTLTGARALRRHLGGNQLEHLINADLNAFLERNLRLAKVNHETLDDLFRGKKISTARAVVRARDPWERPAAFLVLRALAYNEETRFASWDQALLVCQESQTEIKAYFRALRDGKRRTRRGRPKEKQGQRQYAITDHRINACFERIVLTPVSSLPRIIISAIPKSPVTNTNKVRHSNQQNPNPVRVRVRAPTTNFKPALRPARLRRITFK